jgi:hypothetical protein
MHPTVQKSRFSADIDRQPGIRQRGFVEEHDAVMEAEGRAREPFMHLYCR